MKSINLGKISIPLDEYASQGNAVLGIRGSGKSYTATYIAEQLLDSGVPIVAFDPIGIWRFLRVPAKNGGRGYKVVVAGGEHADIPLTANGAAEIMRAAMKEGVSIIFDLYDISLSKGDWRRVVESAIKVLLYENKAHGLRHIFLEEAAEFAPQRIQPDQGAVYSAIERLARMGGNAQLGYTLINQRAEEVNKAVLELCDLLILHRQKGRNSLIALGKWLDVAQVKGKIAEEVPVLENGEAYIWPAGDAQPIKTKIPAKRTFHPDRKAMQQAVAAEAKSTDVSAFVASMKTSLERLAKEAEANDPKLLRKRIAELERAAERANPPGVDYEMLERARKESYDEGRNSGYEAGVRWAIDQLHPMLLNIDSAMGAVLIRAIQLLPSNAAPQVGDFSQAGPATTATRKDGPAAAAPLKHSDQFANLRKSASSAALSKAERAILTVAGQRSTLEPNTCTRAQLSILSGYSIKSSSFANAISALRNAGRVKGHGDQISITEKGLEDLGEFERLPSGAALIEWWKDRLGLSERTILGVICKQYPRAMSREEISASSGYSITSSSFSNALSKLRTLELIEGRSDLRASHDLFNGAMK